LAKKLGIDSQNVLGTGPNDRIMEKDVQLISIIHQPLTPLARMVAAEKNLVVPIYGSGIGGRVTLDDLKPEIAPSALPPFVDIRKQAIPAQRMRRGIAERMLNSVQSTTQCTLNTSVDARSLLSLHQQLKENAKLQQITINDLVLFVVSRVLVDYPQLNMLFTNNSIYRSKHVNLGFTVDTEHGLMIPVLKNAEYLSLEEMSLEARRLSSACLEGNVFPDDLENGTFTVTNLGALGIENFTPILNFPQVGILGIGNINLKPVVVNSKVEFISHIGLSLTVNRQTVKDSSASRFLCSFSQQVSKIDSVIDNEQ
jgi:pyruvate dehydrogenase E2 component (dihydrolipoamide acetyltransferase)